MSKVGTIILVTFLTLIVIGLSVGLFFIIRNGFNFEFSSAKLDLIDSKEFDSINNLDIDTDTADIYIKKSTDEKVKVELYSNDYKEEEINNTSDSLNIVLKKKCKVFCFMKRSKINVYLPESYSNNMTINATTSDIEADAYSSSDINIKVTTGDINLKSNKNATINVTTGDVEIGSVNDINVTSTTGDIKLGKVNNNINIKTTTGDFDIDEVNISKNSSIKTTTGDVYIKNANNIYVDAHTTTGDVKIENNNRKSDIELTINTTTGDVKVD